MSSKTKIFLWSCMGILLGGTILFGFHKLADSHKAASIRRELDLGSQTDVTPYSIRKALLNKFPLGTDRSSIYQQLVKSSVYENFSAIGADEQYRAYLNCGSTFWPPTRKLMCIEFEFDPGTKKLTSIKTEERLLAP